MDGRSNLNGKGTTMDHSHIQAHEASTPAAIEHNAVARELALIDAYYARRVETHRRNSLTRAGTRCALCGVHGCAGTCACWDFAGME